jgi:hypothetical protein
LTTFFAVILISSPVCRLRPVRAARFPVENEPNPARKTRPPFASAFEAARTNAL